MDIFIVSAKFGLIKHDTPIPNYDLQMTPELAQMQVQANRTILGRLLGTGSYDEVFITAGKDYLVALEPFECWQGATKVTTNKGRIGVQLNSLKHWLLRQRGARRTPPMLATGCTKHAGYG